MREEAEKLNISLVYLPPYSPELNPIENLWKSVKRFVSENSPLNVEELKKTVAKAFKKLTESISFAKSWIEKFLENKFKMLCTQPYYSQVNESSKGSGTWLIVVNFHTLISVPPPRQIVIEFLNDLAYPSILFLQLF